MKVIQGDLIKFAKQGQFDVIVHGCNCMCTMGAGIAKSVKATFPEAYEADCQTIKGDRDKLGTCTVGKCIRGDLIIYVINAYTQYHWRGKGVLADYEAIRSCLRWIRVNYGDKRIGLPKIGAGLAGGDWQIISTIIEEELPNENVTLVEFTRT